MPDSWIKEQVEPLRHWIENSQCPMLASMPDGKILYVNNAFAEYVGYNRVELVGDHGKTWKELTVDSGDLEVDEYNVEELLSGSRQQFQLIKSYRHKLGTPKRSQMHVLRWPPYGDFEVFLVTVIPLDGSWDYALSEIETVKSLLVTYIAEVSKSEKQDSWSKFWAWVKEHPAIGYPALGGFLTLIVGDRVVEIIVALKQAIAG